MKKKLQEGAVETTLSMVGDKWKILIVRELLEGTKRFGEIKSGVGTITQKMLTQFQCFKKNSLFGISRLHTPAPSTQLQIYYKLTPISLSSVNFNSKHRAVIRFNSFQMICYS